MNPLSRLVSPKVIAAAAGAGAGSVISTFIVWALGAFVFEAGYAATRVDDAIAAVPVPVVALVGLVLTVLGAYLSGYQTTDPARVAVAEPEEDGPEPRRALVEEDSDEQPALL